MSRSDGYVRVAKVEDVPPGSVRVVEGVDRVSVCLFRVGGEYFAMSGICTHKGAPLWEGRVKGGYVECPWHKANFALRDGKNYWPASKPLRTFEVKVEDGHVFIRPNVNGRGRQESHT